MSNRKKDRVDNAAETEIKKPTVRKYPFQSAKRNSNNSEKKKPENTKKLRDTQGKSKMNKNDPSPEISVTQIVKEAPKRGENLTEMVNERHDQKSNRQSGKDATDIENTETKIPPERPVQALTNENRLELELVKVSEDKETREKTKRKDLTKEEINEICKDKVGKRETYTKTRTPGLDPRFQQQDQTLRCFVMYTDFYRCENILGEGELACQWFKDVFTSICPLDWISHWDEAREEGRLGWTKGKTQGKFPGDRYGS